MRVLDMLLMRSVSMEKIPISGQIPLCKDSWTSAPMKTRQEKGQQNREGKKPSKSVILGRIQSWMILHREKL